MGKAFIGGAARKVGIRVVKNRKRAAGREIAKGWWEKPPNFAPEQANVNIVEVVVVQLLAMAPRAEPEAQRLGRPGKTKGDL
eukprot:CAMPEP_0172611832 /NCGR_PEP_ID=MMETSP1068-20121228/31470_1 /TAXON_ID=35684 /ORGANISM="Pseudopedinella elastica, Strain CCMP716" /LENGTH=81 /DNA_ID=CAMNT_0013415909 /DNA_START=509 /DNA_END=754 /DNA_ORIENTATION=-